MPTLNKAKVTITRADGSVREEKYMSGSNDTHVDNLRLLAEGKHDDLSVAADAADHLERLEKFHALFLKGRMLTIKLQSKRMSEPDRQDQQDQLKKTQQELQAVLDDIARTPEERAEKEAADRADMTKGPFNV